MFPFKSMEAVKNLNHNKKLHSLLDRANAWADRRNERRALATERRKNGVRVSNAHNSSDDALNTLFARREELKRQMEDNERSIALGVASANKNENGEQGFSPFRKKN